MTYQTKVLVLSGLLAGLIVTATLGLLFSGQALSERQTSQTLISGLEAYQVVALELPSDVMLTKTAQWTLQVGGKPYPASQERIDTWLKTLAGTKRDRLVGRSLDLASYGLDSPRRVVVKTAAKTTELWLGNPNDDGTKVYVKEAASAEVWEVNRDFARVFDVDFNTWTDLSLISGKKGSDLARASYTGRLETSDKTVFSAFDVQKGVGDNFDTWSNQVAAFRVASYFGPLDNAVVDGTSGVLTLEWGDGTKTVVTLGQKDAQNNVAGTEGNRRFWINEWALGQLLYRP